MGYKDPERQKQAQHESYLRNKDKVREASKKARDKRRSIVNEIKEATACMDCGVFYPYYVMQFDHRDPSTKVNMVATLLDNASMVKIMEEIKKCDLVCANCHAERTYGSKSPGIGEMV